MSSLLIKNGCLVDDKSKRFMDILSVDGKICRVEPSIDESDVDKIIDAKGLFVIPGLIDSHTHYHLVSRGTVTADSFSQGSRLASFGGVTTVVDFADHNKGMNLEDSLKFRLDEMRDGMAIDYTLHQGVYGHGFNETIPSQLERLKSCGVKTLKIFTTYRETGYLIEDPEKLRSLFVNAKRLGMLVCAHCEFNPLIEQVSANWKGTFLPKDHADLRPAEAEAEAIELYGRAALEVDCPLYVVHVSSEAGLNAIRKLRKQGAIIYAETTPTYLFLDRSKLESENGSLYVMTPPLRTTRDNQALLEALCNGEIDVVATDHCAFTRGQKLESNDVRTVYPGIPGTEEMFHLLFDYSEKNKNFSLSDIVRVCCVNPAKLFGMYPDKGSFDVGTDADFAIVDPGETWTVCDSNIHSASMYSPYSGMELKGRVVTSVLRGSVIMSEGQYFGHEGTGKFIRQKD